MARRNADLGRSRLRTHGSCRFSITLELAVAAVALSPHHRDPFDRMLIAQAQLEGLTIVTRDPRFEPYAVATMAA